MKRVKTPEARAAWIKKLSDGQKLYWGTRTDAEMAEWSEKMSARMIKFHAKRRKCLERQAARLAAAEAKAASVGAGPGKSVWRRIWEIVAG